MLKKLWNMLWRPASRLSLGVLLIGGFVAGITFWGSFNWAMDMSNTEAFCISCHEMRDNVYEEYKDTIHYKNRSGVRAICTDCHVPKIWIYKIVRKVQATNELFHHLMGTVDTPEKFEAKRFELAQNVWRVMEETDSRECRNCHDSNYMALAIQKPRARAQHESADEEGETCIDCHKGIAHKPVHDQIEDEDEDDFSFD